MPRRKRPNLPAWIVRGPRLLGYEPGWLWLGLTVALLVAGGYIVTQGIGRQQRTAAEIDALVVQHAEARGLSIELVRAVVRAESGGDPRATSEVNARGLMQVMPLTKKDVRERFDLPNGDLYDPDYNLLIGTHYLRYLLDRFDGDATLALAAYHMGPTAIARHQRQDPGLTSAELVEKHAGPKTRAYVQRILTDLQ